MTLCIKATFSALTIWKAAPDICVGLLIENPYKHGTCEDGGM